MTNAKTLFRTILDRPAMTACVLAPLAAATVLLADIDSALAKGGGGGGSRNGGGNYAGTPTRAIIAKPVSQPIVSKPISHPIVIAKPIGGSKPTHSSKKERRREYARLRKLERCIASR